MTHQPVSRAVILAGGRGTRLLPLTTVLPKPLLPLGDQAILEVVVRQLAAYGLTDITLAVGYLAHLVQAVLGDGSRFDTSIDYHLEGIPLGTAGALTGIERLDEPFLMMNGDVLTLLDYTDFLDAHVRSGAELTIATYSRVQISDYGVLDVISGGDTDTVVGYREKPSTSYIVSMGVYALSPSVLDLIEPGQRLDLPDLVLRLLERGRSVGSYQYDGLWLDIGRHDDYALAVDEFARLGIEAFVQPARAHL